MTRKNLNFILIGILISALSISSCKKDEEEDPGALPSAPVVNDALHVYGDYFYVNWIGVTGATAYHVDVATDQNFSNILPDYNNKEVAINGMFVPFVN